MELNFVPVLLKGINFHYFEAVGWGTGRTEIAEK